ISRCLRRVPRGLPRSRDASARGRSTLAGQGAKRFAAVLAPPTVKAIGSHKAKRVGGIVAASGRCQDAARIEFGAPGSAWPVHLGRARSGLLALPRGGEEVCAAPA